MLDFSNLPTPFDQQIFVGNMTAVGGLTQVWTKPRGVSMVHVTVIGHGANGQSATAGATSGGGTGGGAGTVGHALIPAARLPDVCYVGAGAQGNTVAVSSIFAVRPYGATTSSIPGSTATLILAFGSTGTGSLAQTSTTDIVLGLYAANTQLTGNAGGVAGSTAGTAGAVSLTPMSLLNSGGGGGGGMSATVAAAGGGSGFAPAFASGGAAGTSGVAGGVGAAGINDLKNFIFTGGGGGGAGFPTATASAGGDGGNGGYGCGGGGGGGAVTGQTAGVGGKGGAGLVIVTCW